MTVPSSAALRMRRSRDRRRQGDVIVSLEVAPKVTADLVELGWVPGNPWGRYDCQWRRMTIMRASDFARWAGQRAAHIQNVVTAVTTVTCSQESCDPAVI